MRTNMQDTKQKKRDEGKRHVHIKLPVKLAERLDLLLDGEDTTKQEFFEIYVRNFVESREVQRELF